MKHGIWTFAVGLLAVLFSCSSGESAKLTGTWNIDTMYVGGQLIQGTSPATTNVIWTITSTTITETSDAGMNATYSWYLDIDSLYLTNGGQHQAYFIQELTSEKLTLWWMGNYTKATRQH